MAQHDPLRGTGLGQYVGLKNEKSPCRRESWQSIFLPWLMKESPEFQFQSRIYSEKRYYSWACFCHNSQRILVGSLQHLFRIVKYILLQRTTIIGLSQSYLNCVCVRARSLQNVILHLRQNHYILGLGRHFLKCPVAGWHSWGCIPLSMVRGSSMTVDMLGSP